MSYFTVLRLYQNPILSKFLLEKCVRQFIKCHVRSCAASRNQRKNIAESHSVQERISKRKALQARIIKNIRNTRKKVEEIIEKENIWTIPNFLCISRIVTSPFLCHFILSQDYQVALWLLGIAGFTDLADGWIARTWTSQASKLGSFLDPVADKLLVGTLFLSLAWVELIPVPLTCLVISRDIVLIIGASYVRYHSLPPPKTLARYFNPTHATVQLAPTLASKINTAMQLLFVAGTLAAPVFNFVDHPFLKVLCYTTAFTTLTGGVSYLLTKDTYKLLKKKSKPERSSDV